jgi:hypothetical protein
MVRVFSGFIYNNPKQTLKAIQSGVVNAGKEFAKADSFEKGRVVGRIAGEIGLAFVGTKGIDKLAKVGKGSKMLQEAGKAVTVSHGMANGVRDMSVVRNINKGEKVADMVDEMKRLTYEKGNEHALVKFATGERSIVSGGQTGIKFAPNKVKRIYGHTHPYSLPISGPSGPDMKALGALGQKSLIY